jgi:hypothetical protein
MDANPRVDHRRPRPHTSAAPLPWLVALLMVALALAGCASAATPDMRSDGQTSNGAYDEKPPDGMPYDGGGIGTDVPPVPPASGGDGSQMIRTGSLQLRVESVDRAVADAQAAIEGLGGFVSASRASGGDDPVAVVTYRIPADRWEDGLAAIRALAVEVVGEQTDSADVSAQLVDIDARLRNLRAAETALQEIARQATRISDVLEVQARLTEVRGQIESLAAQQEALKSQVAYATLTVSYGLDVAAVTQASRQWDPAREVDAATASLVELLQGIASVGIWSVIVGIPIVLMVVVVAFVGIRLGRRLGLRLPRFSRPARPEAETPSETGWR